MRSEAQVVITNPTGLHARPAVKLAQLAAAFDADIQVRVGDQGDWVRARSTARVMKLKASAQSVIHFRADGEQADNAVSALVDFVRRDFDEGPGSASPEDSNPASVEPSSGANPQRQYVAPRTEDEHSFTAEVASRGVAIGVLFPLDARRGAERQHGDPGTERVALDTAVQYSIQQLRGLAEGAGELAADLVEFQVKLLQDEEFLGPVWADIATGTAAETAWLKHLEAEIADYQSADTSYLRDRAADLRDLRERVTMALTGARHEPGVPENAIVWVNELTPSRFLELDWNRAVGIATAEGSTASHAAMLARGRGIPLLVRVALHDAEPSAGRTAVIDAERGKLIFDPSGETRSVYERHIDEQREQAARAMKHAAQPARTLAGTRVTVMVNVDDPDLLASVDASHCDGVGLTRTEFLFHARPQLPDEASQLLFYRRLLEWAGGRPVTIRTLDAGGDKPIGGLTLEGESNPFLGLRGVRLCLARQEVFRIQLRALARAAAIAELKVMIPMVTLPSELGEVRRMLMEEVGALRADGTAAQMPALGMMVEVPAAALSIEEFDADFFSIGTNDLTSYLLAASRDSAATASLLDPLHPALLELIARVAEHGRTVGKEVSVCGEMAANPACLRALLDAGIQTLSVPPSALGSTKAALSSV